MRSSFGEGGTHPRWCIRAEDDTGRVLAGSSWWAEPGTETPILVDLVGIADVEACTALLRHGRTTLSVTEVEAMVIVPEDATDARRTAMARAVEALTAAGFSLAVDRVRVQWLPGSGVQAPSERLRFIAARDLPEADLLALFAAVGDGSLDNAQRTKRAEHGRDQEAAERLAHVLRYAGDPSWFTVGIDADGALVGYVVPAYIGEQRPILAEIGVAAPHRGRHYVDDLLGYGTGILAALEPERIRGDTDEANTPMRAAFRRAGYQEFARRSDYRWVSPPAPDPN